MIRNRRGMTLLELTVGLVITGVVVAAGYATFASVIDRRQGAAVAVAETARATGIHRTLLRWMDGATVQVPSDFSDGSVVSQLTILTRAGTPIRSPLTSVRLFVDDGRAGFGQGLIAMLRPDAGEDSMAVQLDPAIEGMRVEYLVSIAGQRQWQPVDGLQGQTPLAMRVWLMSSDPTLAGLVAAPIEAPTVSAR